MAHVRWGKVNLKARLLFCLFSVAYTYESVSVGKPRRKSLTGQTYVYQSGPQLGGAEGGLAPSGIFRAPSEVLEVTKKILQTSTKKRINFYKLRICEKNLWLASLAISFNSLKVRSTTLHLSSLTALYFVNKICYTFLQKSCCGSTCLRKSPSLPTLIVFMFPTSKKILCTTFRAFNFLSSLITILRFFGKIAKLTK